MVTKTAWEASGLGWVHPRLSMSTYLWCSWGQEGGTILSQCHILKHVLRQLREQVVSGLMSWQLL